MTGGTTGCGTAGNKTGCGAGSKAGNTAHITPSNISGTAAAEMVVAENGLNLKDFTEWLYQVLRTK